QGRQRKAVVRRNESSLAGSSRATREGAIRVEPRESDKGIRGRRRLLENRAQLWQSVFTAV
ncbi:MAG: hypothetical protein L0H29_11610, partial [Sinobacteraceae bacterium]|nr:hypothetical protein [Nevskiaceae bacterium]